MLARKSPPLGFRNRLRLRNQPAVFHGGVSHGARVILADPRRPMAARQHRERPERQIHAAQLFFDLGGAQISRAKQSSGRQPGAKLFQRLLGRERKADHKLRRLPRRLPRRHVDHIRRIAKWANGAQLIGRQRDGRPAVLALNAARGRRRLPAAPRLLEPTAVPRRRCCRTDPPHRPASRTARNYAPWALALSQVPRRPQRTRHVKPLVAIALSALATYSTSSGSADKSPAAFLRPF